MSWDKNIKNYYDNKKKTKTAETTPGLQELIEGIIDEMPSLIDETWNSTKESKFRRKEPEELKNEAKEKVSKKAVKQFILSLPKYTPTEAWGDPKSMERKQINSIFKALSRGGATVADRLKNFNRVIYNPTGTIGSRGGVREILAGLIALESLTSVIRSFNEASAGFVFEGFLAALFQGEQRSERSEKGNLPIEDLVAFTTINAAGGEKAVSLKLLGQGTDIEGSYTNLVDALWTDWPNGMLYVIARKDGKEMSLESFDLRKDNFINAIAYVEEGKLSASGAKLFAPKTGRLARSAEGMINRIKKAIEAKDEEGAYALLKMTKGYTRSDKEQTKADVEDDGTGRDFGNVDIAFNDPTRWGAPERSEKFDIYFSRKLGVEKPLLNLWRGIGDKEEMLDSRTLKLVRDITLFYNTAYDGLKDWEKPLQKNLGKMTRKFEKSYLRPVKADYDNGQINKFSDLFNALMDKKEEIVQEDKTYYTVEENRTSWKYHQEQTKLLTEGAGGTQWNISTAQLPGIRGIDHETIGTLPYSGDALFKMAERYIDVLEKSLAGIFEEVQSLSENVNGYFFAPEGDASRNKAIAKGQKARENAANVAKKIETEVKSYEAGGTRGTGKEIPGEEI
jgi:hypothetical protein